MRPPHLLLLLLVAPTATGLAAVHEVSIEGTGGDAFFAPPILLIRAGESVRWTNNDWANIEHIVSGGNGIDTGVLEAGETSDTYTFEEAGTYFYRCPRHANMRIHQVWVI